MPKLKRSLRRDGDDTQTSGTPTPPQAPASSVGNPFTKWLVGLGVVMLVIVGSPVLMWAKTEVQPSNTNISSGKVLVDATALKKISDGLKSLQEAVDGLNGSQLDARDYMGKVISGLGQDGRASCLNTCRQSLTSCQDKAGLEAQAGITGQALHPCLTQANECITKCNNVPRPPIACEDRCAVAMGGCVEKLAKMDKPDPKYVEQCRRDNLNCLVKACKLNGPESVPVNYCTDQCTRLNNICLSGLSTYDQENQAKCTKLNDACEKNICAPAEKLEPPKPEADKPTSTSTTQGLKGRDADETAAVPPEKIKPPAEKKKPADDKVGSTSTEPVNPPPPPSIQ